LKNSGYVPEYFAQESQTRIPHPLPQGKLGTGS